MKSFQAAASFMCLTSIRLGKELGIFQAMREKGPISSTELAKALNLSPRYMYEWCLQLTANGYLEYDAGIDCFILPPEHAVILCEEAGPLGMLVALQASTSYNYLCLKSAFETDGGIRWGDMNMTQGARAFFKPLYEQLMPHWVQSRADLMAAFGEEEAKIGDIGCGAGISTRELAKLFPGSHVQGIDYDPNSVELAKADFKDSNIKNADAKVIDSHNWVTDDEQEHYSAITMFDCFHDMGDPEGVLRECKKALKPGGKMFLIEPFSSHGDSTKDRLSSPMAFAYQGFNMCCCTPCGKCIPGKEGLGTTAGTERYVKLFADTGFANFEQFGDDLEAPLSPAMHGFRLFVATK